MQKHHKGFVGVLSTAGVALMLAACGDSAPDVELNSPLLEAVGQKFVGKPAPEPNLPERAPLVMPPSARDLPEPGTGARAAANGQWPTDRDEQKKMAASSAKTERERYCNDGDWNKQQATIDDFEKNTNRADRCRPSWFRDMLSLNDKKDEKK